MERHETLQGLCSFKLLEERVGSIEGHSGVVLFTVSEGLLSVPFQLIYLHRVMSQTTYVGK